MDFKKIHYLHTFLLAAIITGMLLILPGGSEAADVNLGPLAVENSAADIAIPVSLVSQSSETVSSVEFTVQFDSTVVSFSNVEITENLVASQKMVAYNLVDDDTLKVLVYGLNNTVISDGDISRINFTLDSAVTDSEIDIRISGVLSSDPESNSVMTSYFNHDITVGSHYPDVQITFPAAEQTLSRLSTLVRATVSDSSINEILFIVESDTHYREYSAGITDGVAETTIDLSENDNQIVAYGYNSEGQLGTDSIHVNVDTDILGIPQFVNTNLKTNTDTFNLEWTDESESGAAGYELLCGIPEEDDTGTYTLEGTVELEDNPRYGGFSAYIKSADGYIETNDSQVAELIGNSENDWSVDMWIQRKADTTSMRLLTLQSSFAEGLALHYLPGKGFRFYIATNLSIIIKLGFAGEINDTQWHHVAVTKINDTYGMYLDGQQIAYTTSNHTYSFQSPIVFGGNLANNNFYIDEVRITDTNSLNANPTPGNNDQITPPAEAQNSDSTTRLLFHFKGVSQETTETTDTFYNLTDLGDGHYSYQVRSFTQEGVFSDYSDPIEVVVDTVAPQVPAFTALPEITNESTHVLTGTKTADTVSITLDAANMTVDEVTYPTATTWQASVEFGQDGRYDIAAFATDAAGNDSIIVWDTLQVDTTAPVVSVSSPSNGYTTPQKAITVEGTVDEEGISMARLTVSNSDGSSSQDLAVENGSFSFDYSLFKGVNTFTVSATDDAGNTGDATIQVSFSNNLPLIFVPIGNKAVGYDETLEFSVRLMDQDQIHPELLSISATGLPGEGAANPAEYDPQTGIFSWTPTEDQIGLYEDVTFIAQDDNKMTAETIKIVVQRYDISSNDFQEIMGSPNSSPVIIGDFNNDNYPDIYMTNVGPNSYFVNNQDGSFSETADIAGCGDTRTGVSALTLDINDDGFQDIYVVNEGQNVLYINNGDGTFREESGNIPQNSGIGIAAYARDINDDGFIDIFLVNDDSNAVFINNGMGTFSDMTGISGLSFNTGAVMACLADIDGDRDCDVYIVQEHENSLYLNDGNGTFSEVTDAAGVGDSTSSCLTRIYDYDYDGDKDIVINDELCNIYYTNDGNATFEKVYFMKESNPSLDGKSSLFFDFDRDGDSDILVVDDNARFVGGLGNILYSNNGDGTFSDATVQANLL